MADVSLSKQEEINYFRASKHEKDKIFDRMLGRFNNQVQADGIFAELKKREFYEKPNEKRRREYYESLLKRNKKEKRRSNAIHNISEVD